MIALIGQAFRIFGNNFSLLAGIALVFTMPRAFIENILSYFILDPEPGFFVDFTMGAMLEVIFGTFMAGGLIAALTGIRSGNQLSFAECIESGVRNWKRLFIARLLPVLLIDIGMLALLLPGILLAIRWLFIDCTVMLERADASGARKRSAQLINGARWAAFGLIVLIFAGMGLMYWGLSVPTDFIKETTGQKIFVLDVCTKTLLGLMEIPITIAVFLFYWQRREEELKAQPATSPEPPPLPVSDAASAQTPE